MEDQKQRRANSDEIDLVNFFRWMGKGFSNFGRAFIAGIAGLRNQFFRNRVFFIGIIVLGLVLGTLYSELLKKDYYKSAMILRCDYLNAQILSNTIDKFNLLASESGREGIMEVLKVDTATAANIQRFTFRPYVSEEEVVQIEVLREQLNSVTTENRELVDKVIKQLELQTRNSYEISVYVYDPNIVKPLEKALVEYFKNTPYVSRRIEINHRNLRERKTKLQNELRKLDSLKLVVFDNFQATSGKNRGSNNVVVTGEESSPLEIFKVDMELHEELQDVEKRIFLTPDFEIIDGFTSFREPESASLPDVLAVSLLLSIVIGYLILGAYNFDRMLASYPSRKRADNA